MTKKMHVTFASADERRLRVLLSRGEGSAEKADERLTAVSAHLEFRRACRFEWLVDSKPAI